MSEGSLSDWCGEQRDQEPGTEPKERTERDIKVSAGVVFGSQHFWYVGYKLAGFK